MSMDVSDREPKLSPRVAEEIRSWMGRRRITGAQLARQLGVSGAWVSYRLTGTQAIDLNDLERIAEVLGVDPGELLPRPTEGRVVATSRRQGGGADQPNERYEGSSERRRRSKINHKRNRTSVRTNPGTDHAHRRPTRVAHTARAMAH